MSNANNGVKPFNAPASELDILVCANVNRKAGIPLPTIPPMAK